MILRSAEIRPGQTGHEAGRELLEKMYRELMGAPMPPIAIGDRGKPYFTEGDLHFSISHTPRHVFCAVAEHTVGVDAEERNRVVNLKLADKILSPQERDQYEHAEDKPLALLTFWVLKEAAAKCSGEGLRGYPANTNFSLEDHRVTEKDGCLVAVIEERRENYV